MSDAFADAPVAVEEQDEGDLWLIALAIVILRDVLPCPLLTNSINNVDANIHYLGNLARRQFSFCQLIYFTSLTVGYFGVRMMLPSRGTSLCSHVPAVVGGSSQKQMIGIDTGGIVAFMTDKHAVRNWAVMNYVGNSMRQVRFAQTNANAITSLQNYSRPNPALSRIARYFMLLKALFRRVVANFVSSKKVSWLTFDQTVFGPITRREWRLLSTAALTVAIWNFFVWVVGRGCEKRELWGMITHVVSSLLAIGQSHGRYQRRVAISIGCHHLPRTWRVEWFQSILAQMNEYCNV